MTSKSQKKYKFFKIITNKYTIILLFFVIWMLFFDENSYLTHREFDKKIEDLENSIRFYKTKINQNKQTILDLKDSTELQRYARERYMMKKENEDVYIIEFDTLK